MGILDYADKSFIFNTIDCISRDVDEVYEFPRQAFYEDYVSDSGDTDSDTDNSEVGGDSSTIGSYGADEEGAETDGSSSSTETEYSGDGETETESETRSETETETETRSDAESEYGSDAELETESEPGAVPELRSGTDIEYEYASDISSEVGVLDADLQTIHGDLQVISSLIVVFVIVMLLHYVYKFFKMFF